MEDGISYRKNNNKNYQTIRNSNCVQENINVPETFTGNIITAIQMSRVKHCHYFKEHSGQEGIRSMKWERKIIITFLSILTDSHMPCRRRTRGASNIYV